MNTLSKQDSQARKHKHGEVVNCTTQHQRITPATDQIDDKFGTRLLPPLRLKAKVTALAIAIGTIPLLKTGAMANYVANQSISQEITQVRQTRVLKLANQLPQEINSDDSIKVNPSKTGHIASHLSGKMPKGDPNLNQQVVLAVTTTPLSSKTESIPALLGRAGLIVLLVGAITAFLAKWAISPILNNPNQEEKQGQGKFDLNPDVEAEDELTVLGSEVKGMADQLQVLVKEQAEQSRRQEAEARRTKLFTDITLRIRKSLSLKDILDTAVEEVRQALFADRVVICRFDSSYSGIGIAESLAPGWTSALGEKIDDFDFSVEQIVQYHDTLVRARDNIYQVGLNDYEIMALRRLEVNADLVVPIFQNNKMFGLLIAHHCLAPRVWQAWEIDFFRQLAIQIGFALDQASLLEQQIELVSEQTRLLQQVEKARQAAEKARQDAELVSQEQRQQKEMLQHQVLELLTDVEEAAKGNLTVRAEISTGEIGTVADFFNAIIESLRRTVTSVKQAAQEVNVSVEENSSAIGQLADEALKQAGEITRTLEEVDQMTVSIQSVAQSASQAAAVARTASTAVEEGGVAMDRTVDSILSLRETVAETAKKVKRLGASSQEISKVVSLINQIALQTNLLAINASIEATRAGEEGLGFAVVAEEVGQLATQSAQATQEIEQIVATIQSETRAVVKAMELSTSQVAEGTDLVKAVKLSLGDILDVSRQIDQLVQSISTATVSQSQTSQNFAKLIQEIAKSSEHTSNFSHQVSSSLKQTVEVAQQLQASVGVFKTGAET